MNLIKIWTAKAEELPITKRTAYKWHSKDKYPRLIFKLPNGKLYWDSDEWLEMVVAVRDKQVAKAKLISEMGKET